MRTPAVGFDEESFTRLARACDRLLETPGAGPSRLAVECLHVLNQHPLQLEKYRDLAPVFGGGPDKTPGYIKVGRKLRFLSYNGAALARNFWRCASYRIHGRPVDFEDINVDNIDVLIVSWLVNIAHVRDEDDFYFGRIQAALAEQGLTSLLVWRNQSGRPAAALMTAAARTGPYARVLLPDVAGLRTEWGLLMKAAGIRRGLRRQAASTTDKLDRSVALFAAKRAVTHATVVNLRLQDQIERLCRRLRPSAVITLYEGYAWERNVWRAARAADDAVVCVGYQHTILQRLAHAVFRPLGRECRSGPDVILTLGEVTSGMLKKSPVGAVAEIIEFGSHRRSPVVTAGGPSQNATFLVLPEGIESECILLFEFALRCAALMPNARFVFRTHPVLPFDTVSPKLSTGGHLPPNVIVSDRREIEADFERAGYLLYRGSSAVLYAVIAGLRPFYVAAAEELSIDPVFELGLWRETVASPLEVKERFERIRRQPNAASADEWRQAAAYCARYTVPIESRAVEKLADIVNRRKIGLRDGISKRNIADTR